ncbi:hypothetical protein [Sphingobium sp.]|uniref:hypothetical protein n=1 Tax=Sphingobium sp. TaxID=1912891 RepID=UPI002BDE9FD5|nr:hypothetical protein [Sphingobium sp.]HUD93030.1 hypothetical protein [Sphingobium sp.]
MHRDLSFYNKPAMEGRLPLSRQYLFGSYILRVKDLPKRLGGIPVAPENRSNHLNLIFPIQDLRP